MRLRILAGAVCVTLVAAVAAASAMATNPNKKVVVYDDFSSGTNAKWSNPYGPGETAIGGVDHQETFPGWVERVRAVPFLTGADFSVYDHLK
jgi:hypothetical protein